MNKILVTGGNGMVGKHLQEILPNATYIGSKECNLTSWKETEYMMFLNKPDHIIHLAAKVGGIQDNIAKPAEYFEDNILINTHILKASKQFNIKRFTGILSTCIYPDVVENYPMKEEDMFLGPPAKTNFSYGYAKRCMAVQIDAHNKQYNTKYNYLIPCNLYSEHDNFNKDKKMHFITALLKKIKSSEQTLNLLGTGKPLRQFMYAGDLAKVIKKVIDNDITDSFNVATPENLSINEMANISLNILNKNLKIKYSSPELDGQFRKDVSSNKMKKIIPNFEFVKFKEGVKKVYDKIS
ncbi:MAG: NAD-dependent epimerase/dehydratase family protein [Flavobacteriales bacterium]|jgi:GDP-L-fucose synthase|nr:NAD-dependent epimerase/dehydratase family protein [Flavobacteriales bacterium]